MRLGILADGSSVGVAGRSSLALGAGDPWARRLPMATSTLLTRRAARGRTVGRLAEAVAHLTLGEADELDVRALTWAAAVSR